MTIKLGQEVQDRITGFKGIAVAKVKYLQGCNRVSVQPKVKDDMALPDNKYFDEPDLIIVGDGILSPKGARPGGPHGHGLDDHGI